MSLFGTGRKEGFLAVALLIALAVLQHAPGVLLGQPRGAVDPVAMADGRSASATPISAEAATNQTILLPGMRQAGEVVREGSWPLWNPYARLGEPFAVTGAPVQYPPFWPLMLEGGARWLDLVLLLHTALACALAYRMLRVLSVSRYGAFIGGGMYGLGWFLTTALDRLPEAAAAAWLPWIIERIWRLLLATRRGPAAALLGVAVAVPFLTGGLATATLGALLGVCGTVVGLIAIEREERRPATRAAAMAFGIAALLTAPLWLWALEHASAIAPRPDTPVAHLQVGGLVALLAPGMFGELGGITTASMHEVNPGAESLELALYPGALTLFVALMGLLRPKRTRLALFWILIAGGALLLAIDGPIAELWRSALPFGDDRPGAILAIFHLATVVLVALGLENFFDAPRARRFAVPAAAGTVLAASGAALFGLWLAPEVGGKVLSTLVGPTGSDDLAATVEHVGRAALFPMVSGSVIAIAFLLWRRMGILRFKAVLAAVALGELCLLALTHVPRVEQTTDPTLAQLLPASGHRVLRVGEPDLPPAGWIAGRDGIRALDADGDRILARTARYLEMVEPGMVQVRARVRVGPLDRPVNLEDSKLLVASVGAALASRTPPVGTFLPMTATPDGSAPAGRILPYVALDPPERFRVAFRAESVDGLADAERALRDTDGPPLDHVVVERAPPEFTTVRPANDPVVEVLEDRPDRIHVRVGLGDGRSYLVVADAFAPGWRATVDDQPTAILPADVALRAVPLREGVHDVVLEYRPTSFTIGLLVAALGAVLAGTLLALRRR